MCRRYQILQNYTFIDQIITKDYIIQWNPKTSMEYKKYIPISWKPFKNNKTKNKKNKKTKKQKNKKTKKQKNKKNKKR